MKTYIGIDNGTSGSIGILTPGLPAAMIRPPSKSEQDCTKHVQSITRIDHDKLYAMLDDLIDTEELLVVCERPLKNPKLFMATVSAVRAFESTWIVLERLGLPRQVIDSRAWQSVLLPAGTKGAPALKKASSQIGTQLFPHLASEIAKQKDADGLLIAEWARRAGL